MSATIASLMFLAFAATSSTVAALTLAVRELRSPATGPGSRSEACGEDEEMPVDLSVFGPAPASRIDRWFLGLVESSGTELSPGLALALVAAGGVLGCAAPLLMLENVATSALGLLTGATIPVVALGICRRRRLKKIQKQLPEGLEIVADCVRAGHSIEQACEAVARDMRGPLAAEFARCAAKLQLGHSLPAVLERLIARAPLAELRIFATAVLVHRQAGGSLGLLSERLARAARDRLAFREHVGAVTSGSRLSAIGLVVASLLGMAVLSWVQPAYQESLWRHPNGPWLVGSAIALQLVGAAWIWRVLRIQY